MSEPLPATSSGEVEMSTAETLTNIFFEPTRTFEALRTRPRFLVASLILLVLTIAVTGLLYLRVDMGAYIREKMEKSPNSAQQTEQQKEMGVRIGKIMGGVLVPASVPVTIAAGAGLYLLGALAFGGSLGYKKALAVWAYSSLPPGVFGTFVAVLVLFLKSADSIDPEKLLVTNPGAFLSAETTSPILIGFLSQFDVLRFYGMFLAALGLRKVGKMSSGGAWGVVITLWIIGLMLRIGSAALFGR
jgi:hypothetical protein